MFKKFNKFLKFSSLINVNNGPCKLVKYRHRNTKLATSIFSLCNPHCTSPPPFLFVTNPPKQSLFFSSIVLNLELCSGPTPKPFWQSFVNVQFSPTDFQIIIPYLCVLFKVTDSLASGYRFLFTIQGFFLTKVTEYVRGSNEPFL